MFREHPDGFIYVNDTKLTLAKFQELEPAYESVGCRIYAQNEYHRIFQDGTQSAGEMPWTEGDIYLGKEDDYKAAQSVIDNVDLSILDAVKFITKNTAYDRIELKYGKDKLCQALDILDNLDRINRRRYDDAQDIDCSNSLVISMLQSIGINPEDILY